ncbi:copper chaperone PCu(A)C [Streptomyces sp. NPDC092296]|uniref:copper chaperone PCu(A)C n=1 Tax=Streptomyces sp. NPDC092296 TaxID=3366012 RepID=UPI00381919E6
MIGRRRAVLAPVLVAAAVLTGCGSGSQGGGPARISVSEAYIPLPASPTDAAGYLTLHNTGGTDDQLVKVGSPDARQVTMHRSTATSMAALPELPVPAHGSAAFTRGGDHLMIMGLAHRPTLGSTVRLDLTFARSGTITVKVPIKPLAYRPSDAGTASGS